ncbi:MAG: type II toxin-antitoxin system CcdA family antitoxin [Acidobacteria bacterium]|nr:type II toxin-antitoxin system CcdA family antitoxin [Acidobacteriota bacterium]MCG3192265.1 hypothetical protein [Thermoanaerobaculia bacterium]MCK6681986.1 DUF6364 family protein [Thermoanaerobaculia bacterium]
MKITLSIDERLVEEARALAAGRGKSLNQLITDLLESETAQRAGEERVRAIEELWAASSGHSGGHWFRREETYAERTR